MSYQYISFFFVLKYKKHEFFLPKEGLIEFQRDQLRY